MAGLEADPAAVRCPTMSLVLRLLLLVTLSAGALPAHAQSSDATALSAQLAQAEADLRAVDRTLDARVDADDRPALRAKAIAAQQAARSSSGKLKDQLTLVDARIAGLGPVTVGTVEPPEIQRQRQRLAQERARIDAAIKRGGLAEVEAQQLIDELDRSQAEQLNQTLSTRVASPLSPSFWSSLLRSIPRDIRRVDLFLSQGASQIAEQGSSGLRWLALVGLALAALFLMPARLLGRRIGKRYLIGSAPGHRVRRSSFAIWTVFVGTVTPLLAAASLVQGLRWGGLVPERWSGFLDGFITAAGFSAFTASLAGAILMRSQPSWRVAPLADATAQHLRPLSWLLAALAFASILIDAFNRAVGVSQIALVTTQVVQALLYLLLIAAFLFVLGRLRAERTEADDAVEAPARTGLGIATAGAWLLVLGAVIALLLGYVGLSIFVARLIVWAVVLGSALYLLMHAADDVVTSLFKRNSRVGLTLIRGLGVRGSLVDQFGLLLSAALRVTIVLVGISMLLSPFGAGGVGGLFGRLGTFAQGIEVAGIAISPGAILRSILVLVVGLALVRGFMGWLERRYLPATDLDGSGRNSISLVARYVGIALAVIWALASLGIGVERVALLLSALSVGIGFGLQAITQNFVSGLILLAERPIKIGDWIRVGTDEGDVKRISVRSTEITLGDHSTLIVPNSELITKSVLNKTLSAPLGRIQIQFSVLLDQDVETVRRIVMDAFAAEPAVLEDPQPAVFIDSIADGRIMFNCFAHVASPRDAYGARSNIFLTLLAKLRERGIDIGTVPQRLTLAPTDLPAAAGKDARPAGQPD
jgi:small-conductance mechanosensitive channel